MDLNLSASSSYGSTSSDISESWILVQIFGDVPRPFRNSGIIRISPTQSDIFDNEEDFILKIFFESIEQTNN